MTSGWNSVSAADKLTLGWTVECHSSDPVEPVGTVTTP